MPKTQQTDLTIKREAFSAVKGIQLESTNLVVDSEPSYLRADQIRAEVKSIRKKFWDRLTMVVEPAYRAYKEAQELRKEVVDPFDRIDVIITGKMKDYRLAEARRLAEERRKQEEEAEELERQAEEKRLAAERAKTVKMGAKLNEQAESLAEQAKEVSGTVITGVQAQYSGTRTVKKIRVTNLMALLKGIVNNEVPDDVITLDQAALNAYYKGSREDALKFPGVEEYEDIQIVGRR